MQICLLLFIKRLVGIVSLFSNSQWVNLIHICFTVTPLLAILIEILLPCPLSLVNKSISHPQKVKQKYLNCWWFFLLSPIKWYKWNCTKLTENVFCAHIKLNKSLKTWNSYKLKSIIYVKKKKKFLGICNLGCKNH